MYHLNKVTEVQQAVMLMQSSYLRSDEIFDRSNLYIIYFTVCKTERHLTKWLLHYVKHKTKSLPVTAQLRRQ